MNPILFRCVATAAFLLVLLAGRTSSAVQESVTLTLPAAMIRESVQSLLPLPIDPGSKQLQGRLVLDSVDKFEMRDNGALIHGVLLGSDLVLHTRVGKQNLNLKIGEVRLPLRCDFTFRFDRASRTLFVRPRLEQPEPTRNPNADAVLPILTLLGNAEYPVALDSLQAFNTRVGDQEISVAMEPVDIRITAQQMVVKMRPKLRKTH